ncbi:MAG: hypothetical protein IPJ07_23550 [Acidobacteria bacterium]|nr:hypothetical protein [Acidobacteriota bacterium]
MFPNVSIYDDTSIGARCRIHSGTVIGADGFSFTPDESGKQFKLLPGRKSGHRRRCRDRSELLCGSRGIWSNQNPARR